MTSHQISNAIENINNTFFYNVKIEGNRILAMCTLNIKGYLGHNEVVIRNIYDKDIFFKKLIRGCDYNNYIKENVDFIINDINVETTEAPIMNINDIVYNESLIK